MTLHPWQSVIVRHFSGGISKTSLINARGEVILKNLDFQIRSLRIKSKTTSYTKKSSLVCCSKLSSRQLNSRTQLVESHYNPIAIIEVTCEKDKETVITIADPITFTLNDANNIQLFVCDLDMCLIVGLEVDFLMAFRYHN